MLWLVATALGGPPGLVLLDDDAKALAKAQKITMMPGMETVKLDNDHGLADYLGKFADLCSVALTEEAQADMVTANTDRPELWVAKGGEHGMGLWKWNPELTVLQRHIDSEALIPQPADVVVLEWDGTAPELSKKVWSKMGHDDVKVRPAPDTSGISKTLMQGPEECIPGISKEELETIDTFAVEGRALYIAVVPPKGKPFLWRWDRDLQGLRRI